MNLNVLTPVNSLGYGVAGSNIAYQLAKRHAVSLFPIGPFEPAPAHTEALNRARLNAGAYDPRAPSVRVFHQNMLAEHVGRGVKAGFPFFELDRLSAVETHHMNQQDAILVASRWAAGVAEESGVAATKLSVVPLGVDRDVFHEGVEGDGLYADQTVFFATGKWEVRKGHDFVLRCFNKAFTRHDKVVLRMMCYNPLIGDDGNNRWAVDFMSSRMGAAGRIDLPPRAGSQAGVARFMASCDVGLFASRAEGWNLGLLDAMSMGKPVVATNYSAHTEYCDAMNASLIEVRGTEAAHDGYWFRGEGNWAALGPDQEEQTVAHMRSLHAAKQCGAPLFNALGVETAKRYSWEKSSEALVAAL